MEFWLEATNQICISPGHASPENTGPKQRIMIADAPEPCTFRKAEGDFHPQRPANKNARHGFPAEHSS
jgi:hypothetical protein